ncbi:amino acid adenylation domain-containing protein, partial [Nocardia lasii]
PRATALVGADETLTYGELDRRSDQLAAVLARAGARPGTYVALALARSVAYHVALWAITKTGAAFMPLDLRYPQDRLAHMVADSAAVLGVTTGDALASLPDHVAWVCLDDPATIAELATAPTDYEHIPARLDDAAYLVYTSGSTGQPKGVVVTHTGLAGFAAEKAQHYRVERDSRVLQVASPGFDAVMMESLMTYAVGAALVVSPAEVFAGAELTELIRAQRVSHTFMTPSVLATLRPEGLHDLRMLTIGGEALSAELVAAWAPGRRFHNVYGPTETTIAVTVSEELQPGDPITIGAPIRGVGAVVLDTRLRPVPVGVVGELYLSGHALARGYLNRPGATAGTFVADPYGEAGTRMYRTGDLVRWSAEHTIEYVGRADFQVKIRGQRVELGEIDAALVACPRVASAITVSRRGPAGQPMLAAYLVAEDGATLDTAAIRDRIASALPEHMVPSVITVLDEMPVSATGKVNRRALPEPVVEVADSAVAAVATALEATIAGIFAEVLGVASVGADESFFALGGDSIMSIQLASRLKAAGIVVTARDIFENRTVRGLAGVAEDTGRAVLTELPGGGVGEIARTPIVSWFLGRPVADRFAQSLLVELPGDARPADVIATVAAVLDRHDMLRARLCGTESARSATVPESAAHLEVLPRGAIDADTVVSVRRFGAENAPGSAGFTALAEAALEHASARLSPADAAMVQVVCLLPEPGVDAPGRALIVIHHLVVDGVSWRILVPDFVTAWQQLEQGRAVELPEVGTSMRRWAEAVSVAAETRADELDLWQRMGARREPLLGRAALDPTVDLHDTVERMTLTLPVDLTTALLGAVPQAAHAGTDDGLLAGLVLALGRWRAKRGVAHTGARILLESHGRAEQLAPGADLSRTVGWFTSAYPVDFTLDGTDPRGAVKAIKEQLRAVPDNGVGYGMLRHLNRRTADVLAALPEPQISFNNLGRAGVDIAALSGVAWIPAGENFDRQASFDPDMPAAATLSIDTSVLDTPTGPSITAQIGYAARLLDGNDVHALLVEWLTALTEIAEHATLHQDWGLTPSDTPLVALTQRDLDLFTERYGPIETVWSMAPLQAGLLFHAELAAGELDVYTAQSEMTLTGPLDEARLRRAAVALLGRHPNLRAAFTRTTDGVLAQVVPVESPLPWRRVEAPVWAVPEILAVERETAFDPADPPLVRFVLVAVAPGEHRLLMTAHHLLLDGWSLPLMLRDLVGLYAAGENAAQLPPAPSYGDYLAWLARRDTTAGVEVWRAAMAGFTEPTLIADAGSDGTVEVPTDLSIDLDDPTTTALTELARATGVTMSTMVQFAWATVLANQLGRERVVFGETVSGRPAEVAGVESMIGLFINTLPVPVHVRGEQTIARALEQLQDSKTRLLDHHHVELSGIMAALGGGQLFDTLVAYESYPVDSSGLGDAEIDGVRVTDVVGTDAAHYPITVQAHHTDTLHIRVRYQAGRVDAVTATGLAARVERVLRGIAVDPSARVGELDLLSVAERVALVPARGARAAAPQALTDLLRRGVAVRPDGVAARCGSEAVTFTELDTRAHRLAHWLIERGVRSGDTVGLVMPRSITLITALWALAEVGAAGALLDPRNPDERLAVMLSDCGARVVLTVADTAVPEGDWSRLVLDDPTVQEQIANQSSEVVSPTVRADDLAYVIYTSGTTGTPKGVAVTQSGLANFTAAQRDRYRVSADSRVLQCAAPGFDAVMLELLMAHPNGAGLVISAPDTYAGTELAELIRDTGVTHAFLTPTVLATMSPAGLDSLEVLVAGGEAVPADLAAVWAPGRRMFNGYGPTETTIMVAISDPLVPGAPITLGGPIRGTRAMVLDTRLRPVPVGVTGELYVGGIQLARGYLGRPATTAATFLADPYTPGARMYRTGDRVRWTADHTLDYVGRTDHQVKIRGQRIELGEIEAVLAGDPAVTHAVALVRTDEHGTDRLIGYLTGDSVDPDQVRAAARRRLPAHMVPDLCVVLDHLPLTTSGKLDRAALPMPAFAAVGYVAPADPTEQLVAEICAEVLELPRVGMRDSFFDLGGNSLTATRLTARLSSALGVRVAVRDLFEYPTMADLAARLTGRDHVERPALTPRGETGPVPLSPAQQRMWFLNRLDASVGAYNVPLVIRLTGELDGTALRAACAMVIDRHESLRTKFPMIDGAPRQVIVEAEDVVPDLTPVPIEESVLPKAAAAVLSASFQVTEAPPIRAELFELGPDDHVLVFAVHHICADGLSMIPLARDVAAAYHAVTTASAPAWPPLTVQYPDYALWQRSLLGDEHDPQSLLSRQLDYWREALAGLPELLELPTDMPRPPVASMRGRVTDFAIEPELQGRIGELAKAAGVTPFMVAHAALAILLARLADTDDVAVGTPVSGRGERELDDLIGMFVNTVVLRTPVPADQSFDALLAQVRSADLAALAHAEVSFEQVVEALNPPRSTAHLPLYQVTIDYQNLDQVVLELPGITVRPVEDFVEQAQSDLNVKLVERFDADGNPAGTIGRLTYATDLFVEESMQRFARWYIRILEAVTADPHAIVGDIEFMDHRQRLEVLDAAGELGVAVPEATIADLFARRATAAPDAVAVTDGTTVLTYGELAQRAETVAARLIAHGAGPETLVAVALPRSTDLVVGLLAVVMSGAAYLPLDVAYPAERLRFVLDDAAPVAMLTTSATVSRVPEFAGPIIELDDDTAAAGVQFTPVSPDNLAYMIYTSGSTGRPKGVAVTHRDVVTLLTNAATKFDIGSDDVWTLFHSYAFDFAVWEMWGALLSGGRLVVVDYDTSRTPDAFVDLVARERVTVLSQTPSAFYGFIDAQRRLRADDLALRYIVFGGEALDPARLGDWLREHPAGTPRLVNMYGITETTVHVTYADIDRAEGGGIGRALPGMAVYVLDDRLRPVPVGVAGDLYVGGGQLSRGYHGAGALTAGRFVADPFGAPGTRLYRTGDVGRWRRGGTGLELDYLGRADAQIQLRGFRIELGEVESALLRHLGVAQAAAAVHRHAEGVDQLIGYVVPADGHDLDPDAVRVTAAELLTGYMVPSAVVVLPALPVTVNGKLDRKALPAPDFERAADAYEPPRTPTEIAIAEVFAETLRVARVGAGDGFFDLGGNSLLATVAVTQLHARDVRIELPWMFDDATPRALARRVDEAEGGSGMQVLLPLRPDGVDTPLFAIHPAGGLAWFYGGLVGHLGDTRPVFGLQDPHVVAGEPSATSIEELAQRYVEEIRRTQPRGPYHLLGWSLGGEIAHAVATRLQDQGERIGVLAMMDSAAGPLETAAGPDSAPGELMADLLGGWRELFDLGDTVSASTTDQAWQVVRDQITGTGLFSGEQIDRVMESFATAGELADSYTPRTFVGDLVFFTAGKDRDDTEAIAGTWQSHITGTIHNTVLDARHLELTHPSALAVIGPILEGFMTS